MRASRSAAILVGLLFSLSTSAWATGKTAQTIVFPQKFSLGTLYLVSNHAPEDFLPHCAGVRDGKGRLIGEARGKVTLNLDGGSCVYLYPSYELIEHPEALSAVPPGLINCVSLETVATMVPVDRALPVVAKLKRLLRLDLNNCELTDAQLRPIKEMRTLQALALGTNMINGSCFECLPTLPDLRDLNASDNVLTHQAYKYIGGCKDLAWLDLGRTQISDADIMELTKLQKLAYLGLRGAHCTRVGLAQLNKLRALKTLDLTGSTVSVRDLLVLKDSTITTLHLPRAKYSMIEMQALQKGLPHTHSRPADHSVDAETAASFGPLH